MIRIRKNIEFRAVYRRGRSFSDVNLVLYIFKNNNKFLKVEGIEQSRIGISVSKKVGKSVIRSRVKRLISESYRLNESKFKIGFDYVFIARNPSKDKTYKEIQNSVLYLFEKAGLYNSEKNFN